LARLEKHKVNKRIAYCNTHIKVGISRDLFYVTCCETTTKTKKSEIWHVWKNEYCNTQQLQHTATATHSDDNTQQLQQMQHMAATHCNTQAKIGTFTMIETLQHSAPQCVMSYPQHNTLTAKHRNNTLQHSATQCVMSHTQYITATATTATHGSNRLQHNTAPCVMSHTQHHTPTATHRSNTLQHKTTPCIMSHTEHNTATATQVGPKCNTRVSHLISIVSVSNVSVSSPHKHKHTNAAYLKKKVESLE